MQDVLPDRELRKDDIVLRYITNDLLVSSNKRSAAPFLSVTRGRLSYFDMFPGTPLILVIPPVCAVLPINTLTKVATDY